MPITKQYSFYPGLGSRPYSAIADSVSVSAMHIFDLMLASGLSAHFSYAHIERLAKEAHHFHSTAVLDEDLLQLEQAKGLVVEEAAVREG
jgi:hypothetical protein